MSISQNIVVRKASVGDLPGIHQLIRESFAAMNDLHDSNEIRSFTEKNANEVIKYELQDGPFQEAYFSSPDNCFWVAEHNEHGIVGCVAIKRANNEESELVRMAVKSNMRNGGIGGLLLSELFTFCLDHRIMRIFLTTANPLSSNFYVKNGFTTTATYPFTMSGFEYTVFRQHKYLGEKIIRHVSIVGGTHGNERIGVELIRQWLAHPHVIKRSTFGISTIIGNPRAVEANRRFLDEDLNRQFAGDVISQNDNTGCYESQRAHFLNSMLGPKTLNYTEATASDFCIDLHSSNSAVGLVAMISSVEDDLLAARLSVHLKTLFPELKITSSPGKKHASYSVDSITPNGIAFEVGPLVHGTVNSTLLEQTRLLVLQTLLFLDTRNVALIAEGAKTTSLLRELGEFVDNYGSNEFDSLTTPIVSSALAPDTIVPKVFPTLEYYEYAGSIFYPTDETSDNNDNSSSSNSGGSDSSQAQKKQRTDTSKPFAYQQYIIHPSLEGTDWSELKEGAPLLISATGCGDVISYEVAKSVTFIPAITNKHKRSDAAAEEYEPLFPLFVNEAAYQDRKIACAVFRKKTMVVY